MGRATTTFLGLHFALCRPLLATLAAICIAVPAAHAADDWAYQYYWYEPEPMASVDQAAGTIIGLQKFFIIYGGMAIDQVVVTQDGLAIHASETSIQQNSQYVPSYGGSWIGGRYVPYYGGSTVTTPVPVTSKAQAFVSYKHINRVGLLYFPKLKNHWGVDFIGTDASHNVILRTSDEGLARQYANASVTLILATNPVLLENYDLLGAWGVLNDAKAIKKAKFTGAGFVVNQVAIGGPAERAGIKAGDIIASINGKPWDNGIGLGQLVGPSFYHRFEFSFDLEVFRNRQLIPLRFTGRNRPLEYRMARFPPKLGAGIREVAAGDPAVPGEATARGVVITAITQTGLAERMQMRPGDNLLEVNGTAFANDAALIELLKAGEVKTARLLRDGVVIELKAPPKPAATAPAAPERLGLGLREMPMTEGKVAYLEVVSVVPGLAAAKLDLRVGDKLVEVNGRSVSTIAEFKAIVTADPITSAKVERAGAMVTLGAVANF